MGDFFSWLSQSWIIIAAIIGGITLLWNFFNKTFREIKDSLNKPFEDINKRFDCIENKIDTKHRNDDCVMEALLSLQRKSIMNSCEEYINRGYANLHQKETLMAQFESYNALGGNSFIHELVEQVQDLPLEPQKKTKLNE